MDILTYVTFNKQTFKCADNVMITDVRQTEISAD